jgi:hypothetical protein
MRERFYKQKNVSRPRIRSKKKSPRGPQITSLISTRTASLYNFISLLLNKIFNLPLKLLRTGNPDKHTPACRRARERGHFVNYRSRYANDRRKTAFFAVRKKNEEQEQP